MPFDQFASFEACERHFANDDDISDPGAFCAYLEDQVISGKAKPGDKIIWGLDVEVMSLVDRPAVGDSEFVKGMKSKGFKTKTTHEIEFLQSKKAIERDNHIVYAPALIPDVVDGNGEFLSKPEIFNASVKYAEHQKVDAQHDFGVTRGYPVHNWVLKQDETWETPTGRPKIFPEGTWMVGIKVTDVEAWEKIQSGELTGFSIAGYWKAYTIKNNNTNTDSKSKIPEVDTMDNEELMKTINEILDAREKASTEKENAKKEAEEKENFSKLLAEMNDRLKALEDATPVSEEKEEEKKESEDDDVDEEDKEDNVSEDEEEEKKESEDDDEDEDKPDAEKKSVAEPEEKLILGKKEDENNIKFKSMDDMIDNYESYMQLKYKKE